MLKLFFFLSRWAWVPTFAPVRVSRPVHPIAQRAVRRRFTLLSVGLLASIAICQAQQPRGGATPLSSPDRTANAGKVTWNFHSHDFGNLTLGDTVSVDFKLKNISNEELHLLQVSALCYCTTPYWDKSPIAPGESRTIRIEFVADKVGQFIKVVTVKTNFDPEQALPLAVKGKVASKE